MTNLGITETKEEITGTIGPTVTKISKGTAHRLTDSQTCVNPTTKDKGNEVAGTRMKGKIQSGIMTGTDDRDQDQHRTRKGAVAAAAPAST